MKQLLEKEFKLTGSPLTFIFLLFSVMTMIPGYPILVGAFFICLGIFYTFRFAREYNDVLYTALLPVAKKDVVNARFLFVLTMQAIAFVVMVVLTLLRMSFMANEKAYVENPLMNANLVFLGGCLVIFALFNLLFVVGFFKTAYYFGKSFAVFTIVGFIFIGFMETLHHLPGMEQMNTCGWENMGTQIAIFIAGILIYVAGTWFAWRRSIETFEMIDL